MIRASFIAGIVGGILGLLLSQAYILFVAALTGIIGAVLSRKWPRVGGVVMLVTGLTALIFWSAMLISLGGTSTQTLTALLALIFWTVVLIAGGIFGLANASRYVL